MKADAALQDLSKRRPATVVHAPAVPPSSAQGLLQELLTSSLIRPQDWESLPAPIQDELENQADRHELLAQLVDQQLLTEYQADRISAGKIFGLILGNYRVLDRLGIGGMAVVLKAEHLRLPRLVAIKVVSLSKGLDPEILQRFFVEMRAVAQLQHPNIVSALDAGEAHDADPDAPVLHYLVMEYVAGQDLEGIVQAHGPLAVAKACDLIHQVAGALAEAHQHHLVHRDIKPSNILVTAQDQAKLLDFGLARQFRSRLTAPGAVLGTVDYIAPEQVQDSSLVDIRADLYGLGATLFWCLTGRVPFPPKGTVSQDLASRLTQSPPSVRTWQPRIPAELDALVARMMAVHREDRFPTPQAVMQALLPFLKPASGDLALLVGSLANPEPELGLAGGGPARPRAHQALIVDDEAHMRTVCRQALELDGICCAEADNGLLALQAINAKGYDLVLLDIDMPEMTGAEVLQRLRKAPPSPHAKIIMFSGRSSADEMAQMLLAGADDYLTKPVGILQLRARVKAALRLKDAQDRSDLLNRHLLMVNQQLEQNLSARDIDFVQARNALVLALAELVAYRDTKTGAHLLRLQRYCRCLAEEAASLPAFAGQIDPSFIQMLECCAPLLDIGKVSLPDHILLKPGKLDADERLIMQTHTTLGASTLQKVAQQHGFSVAFFQMAMDIARHHHERYDGKGYPDRLAGNDIPLAARLVAIADVYDALRSRRPYKPAFAHAAALQLMVEGSAGQFDPLLLQAFQLCASGFERIAQETPD